MIKYALGCAEGHEFESWFPDSAAYEKQRKRLLVACPECGSTAVDKAIMAPAVVGDRRPHDAPPASLLDAKRRQAREMVVRLRQEIEAEHRRRRRQIPRGGARHSRRRRTRAGDPRPGEPDEARALIEEGVDVMPMPALADEMN